MPAVAAEDWRRGVHELAQQEEDIRQSEIGAHRCLASQNRRDPLVERGGRTRGQLLLGGIGAIGVAKLTTRVPAGEDRCSARSRLQR